MIDGILNDAEHRMQSAVTALDRDLDTVRTGRARPALVETLKVEYYGAPTPLNQMAAINAPEPRLITVKPWDKTQIKAVEKAIRDNDLGLNPQADKDIVRIPLPPLTEERRKEFVKIAKKYGEECKVGLRKARHDALDMLTQIDTDGEASQDDVERAKKRAEDAVAEAGKHVDAIVAAKEKDILEV